MVFDSTAYGPEVAEILALDGSGERLMPLVASGADPAVVRRLKGRRAAELFPKSAHPEAAMAGLWTYFSGFEEAHTIAQDVSSVEGSYWHGILNRQEPDAWNSGYWFRRVGTHSVFGALRDEAEVIVARYPRCGFRVGKRWEPEAFIEFCERSRGTEGERAALEIQRVEWQLLFAWCGQEIA